MNLKENSNNNDNNFFFFKTSLTEFFSLPSASTMFDSRSSWPVLSPTSITDGPHLPGTFALSKQFSNCLNRYCVILIIGVLVIVIKPEEL